MEPYSDSSKDLSNNTNSSSYNTSSYPSNSYTSNNNHNRSYHHSSRKSYHHSSRKSNRKRHSSPGYPIIVYLLTDRPTEPNVQKLIKFFNSSDFYHLKVTDLPPPPEVRNSVKLNTDQAVEIYRYQEVLNKSYKKYPDRYTLILKDTSVTTTSPDSLEKIIRATIDIGGWDICYLTRWLDRCDLYRNAVTVDNQMSVIVKTLSPNGTQALLFSPKGKQITIGQRKMNNGKYFTPINIPLDTKFNEEIQSGNMSALCTTPNQFEFDVFQARSTTDLAKLSDCRRPENNTNGKESSALPFVWFAVIVIIVIIIAWALYILGPSNHVTLDNKNNDSSDNESTNDESLNNESTSQDKKNNLYL